VHQRPGEQVSGTVVFAILHREKANKVFGSALRATAPKRLLHLLLGGLLYDYFLFIFFLVAYCTTTSWRLFEGLHRVHLPASTLYDYID
jgi:hypothetical protein